MKKKPVELVGKAVYWTPAEVQAIPQSGKFRVRVWVNEARRAYGRQEFLITPLMGNGRAWVSRKSLELPWKLP